MGGLIGDWTNCGIRRIVEFVKCLKGNLSESHGYPLLLAIFGRRGGGGLPEHSVIQTMGLSLMFSEFRNL